MALQIYFPSKYGFDADRVQLLELAKSVLEIKVKIRQAIRMAGIPFTFVSSNLCATYFLSRLGQVEGDGAPKDEVSIIGDGNAKGIIDAANSGTYTYVHACACVADINLSNKMYMSMRVH